ncbi:hypothetical protein BH23ACT9_BH23ACT9_38190 [soil metagenome]
MKRLIVILAALAMIAPITSAAAQDVDVDKSDNVDLVYSDQYTHVNGTGTQPFFRAGTDLAFDGDIIIAAQQGPVTFTAGGEEQMSSKIHLYERLDEDEAAEVGQPFALRGTIPCFGGGQNDVASFAPGIVAVGYHSGTCGNGAFASAGVSLHDITDPTDPILLSTVGGLPGGTHTLTVHPSKPIVYASPGGIANGGGTQQIIDFTDILAPVLHTFQPNAAGCHDFSVIEREDGTFGICVGLTESQIWDLEDPVAPVIVSRIVNPLVQFNHTGVTTSDGTLLVIGDETLAAQECAGGPTGAMFAYDITDPALPIPRGFFAIDRNASDNPISAQNRTNWCTAHIFSFVGDTHTMVASWYTGGMNVIDWSDPMSPREVAHYRMDDGTRAGDTTNYWSAYFHEGLVYANDRGRGAMDVLEVDGLTEEAGLDGAPATREGAWFSGSILDAPLEMHAHAQRRRLLAGSSPWAMVCALAPAAMGDRAPLAGLRVAAPAPYGSSLLG